MPGRTRRPGPARRPRPPARRAVRPPPRLHRRRAAHPAGTPADQRLQPLISYLHLTPDAAATAGRAAAPAVRITEDDGQHRDLVRGWLATAVSGAQADLGTEVAEEAVREAVEEILHAPARRTWLAWVDGHDRPIGHATAVTDAYDDAAAPRSSTWWTS
ncbi:hypothetical protein ACFQ1I_33555 [Kitasatospora arboriphila]